MSDVFALIESGLLQRGFTADQARGITAGIYAEGGISANGTFNTNPTSGALGLGQWLGQRKANVLALARSRGETTPSLSTQLDYLVSELRGGDPGGRSVLSASGQGNIASNYITRFMRPAAGAETTGDLQRASTYLNNRSGVGGGRIALQNSLGTTGGNLVADTMVGLGNVLSAPGNFIEGVPVLGSIYGAEKAVLYGGLDLSGWFTRITFGIFAILLIAVALFMLSGKSVSDVTSAIPPVIPV